MIGEEVEDFVVDPTGQEIKMQAKNWKELLGRRQVDYSGKLVSKAMPISWQQIEPGLPGINQAAQVNAMDLAEGDMRRIISSPWETMKPRSEWPQRFKRARTLAVSKEDYYKVVHGMWLRRMIREVKKEELLYDSVGTKLAGALFGVEKDSEVPLCPGLLVLRLILNLVPPNELQVKIAGDNQTLPYIGQWKNMNVARGDPVYLNSEDMKACFFLFCLPSEWAVVFGLDEEVPGWVIEKPEQAWADVGMVCIPMGWINAVGILQYLHRQLARRSSLLPRHLELRRDAPMPVDEEFLTTSCLEFYVDNMDGISIGPSQNRSTTARWILKVRQTGEEVGIIYDDGEKRVVDDRHIKTMGAEIQGELKAARLPSKRRQEVVDLVLYTLSLHVPSQKVAEVSEGVLVHVAQFRRQLMCTHKRAWAVIAGEAKEQDRTLLLAEDFLKSVALMPFAAIHLDTRVTGLATASDASESGGGVTASRGLSAEGRMRLWEGEQRIYRPVAEELLFIELFAGIGGGRRALQLLGVTPGSHLIVENDADAARVLQENFPEARHWPDVRTLDAAGLQALVGDNPHVRKILVFGGFPCQDLSGLNHQREGLGGKRSSLLMEMIRIESCAAEVWPHAEIESLWENVASMKIEDRNCISQLKGTAPISSCPGGKWPMKRPRLYWLRGKPAAVDGTTLTQDARTGAIRLEFDGPMESPLPYLGKNYQLPENFDGFYTFVRSIPRKKAGLAPMGVDSVDENAKAAWAKDEFRFAPYQYASKNLVLHRKRGEWVPAPTEARELLMGFRAGHTEAAAIGRSLKITERQATHIRDSLVGNAVHTPTVAVLLAGPLHGWGFLASLPRADDLAGMQPGWGALKPQTEELRLARMYASYQTHRSNEIRLENGPFRTSEKPTWQAVRASQWKWAPVVSCQWQVAGDTMPALETRAVHLALKWRARAVHRLSSKFLHLVDSQSALGCSSRHRSSADTLAYLVERSCAVQLAGRLEPIFAFVRTHLNPADKPSRVKLHLHSEANASPKNSVLLCNKEDCRRLAPYQCDNCSDRICVGHLYCQGRTFKLCTDCQGFHVATPAKEHQADDTSDDDAKGATAPATGLSLRQVNLADPPSSRAARLQRSRRQEGSLQ